MVRAAGRTIATDRRGQAQQLTETGLAEDHRGDQERGQGCHITNWARTGMLVLTAEFAIDSYRDDAT